MATPTTENTPTPRRSRRTVEDLSPEAWLLKVSREQSELIDDKDFRYLSSVAPASVLQACTERYLPMIWSKVLFPNKARPQAAARPTGAAELEAFIDVLWVRYRKMTGAQARGEAGALVTVFAGVKPKQTIEAAMTREQFGQRFAAAKGA